MDVSWTAPDLSDKDYRFVNLVADVDLKKVAIVNAGNRNYYYSLESLENLASKLDFANRLEISSIIHLMRTTRSVDLMIDLDAHAGLVTTELSNEYDLEL